MDTSEENDSKKGMLGSFLFHMLLLIAFLMPAFSSVFPPPGPRGVLVSFGNPTNEAEEEAAPTKKSAELTYKNEESPKKPQAESIKEIKEVKKQLSSPEPVKEVKAKYESTAEDIQDESAIALKKAKAKEKKLEQERLEKEQEDAKAEIERNKEVEEAKNKAIAEAARQEAIKAEEKRKADEQRIAEEKRKADEARKKQEAYEKTKSELGGLFSGDGTNTDAQGQQGDPDGKNKSDILEGLSSGTGQIGGGLSGRGILFEPKIVENSQKTGIVVVKVCVNKDGKVISSKYTQRGSTTTESELVAVAEKSASKYVFSPGELSEQCGTITIDFRLK